MRNKSVRNPIVDAAFSFWQKAKKPQWHRVEGSSMWPVLKSGDKVLVVPEIDHLTVGDIVLIRLNQRLLVHRIDHVLPSKGLITWGDFNSMPDPQIRLEQVIGKVKRLERDALELSLGGWRSRWGAVAVSARVLLMPIIRLLRLALRIRNAANRRRKHL